jgi:hypothetical protein
MNLLPKTEKDNLKKGLKNRFVIVALFLLSASFLIGFIMLLPSYFLASSYFSRVVIGDYFSESKNDDSVKNILDLPTEISLKLGLFQSNLTDVSVADYFSKIVSLLPEKVQLKSISFSKNQDYNGKSGAMILVSGIAGNRDSLVSFSNILKNSNLFSVVDVPVSSLTRDKNLPFSINIFIENQK